MFDRVTHTLDDATMRVRSVFYLIHIPLTSSELFFGTEREYTLFHLPVFH